MVVGVVGSMGSSGPEERVGMGVAVKRKRREESVEEPGSSGGVIMPTSKKRIRLRPRVQVSASSSQAPDTQGSSMAKVRHYVYAAGLVAYVHAYIMCMDL